MFIACPIPIVHLDKSPTHHSLLVNHVSCGVWPAWAVRIKNPEAVDHLVVPVFEKRKINLCWKILSQILNKPFRLLMGVDADSQNLNFFLLLLGQKTFQLPELLYAVGSPMATVEDKNHILYT